jgi:hypothetical protein
VISHVKGKTEKAMSQFRDFIAVSIQVISHVKGKALKAGETGARTVAVFPFK